MLADGRPVAVHGRAFDLLAVLVENRERIVGRDELLATVWAGTTVSDSNIAVQVASLRRILSAHGIAPKAIFNVPGRGYQFVGEVEERGDDEQHDLPVAKPDSREIGSNGLVPARRRRWPVLSAFAACLVII